MDCRIMTINSVSKSLSKKRIIDNLSLEIKEQAVTVLVGKNGCGKTTLIKIIAGLLAPDSGTITHNKNLTVGVLLGGDANLYEKMSGYENLKFFAKIHKLSREDFELRCNLLAEKLMFRDYMYERVEKYSRGMRQKIAFAVSIIHDPVLILLDEPSTGLDIQAMNTVLEFINYCREDGKAILIASHNMTEITELSDYIAIMNNGKIVVYSDTISFFSGLNGVEKINKIIGGINGEYT